MLLTAYCYCLLELRLGLGLGLHELHHAVPVSSKKHAEPLPRPKHPHRFRLDARLVDRVHHDEVRQVA